MPILATVLILATGSAQVALPMVNGPIVMKQSEIRAYNAKLSRDHPHYIRCVMDSETGSLVKSKPVCRTNQEWDRVETDGNNTARETVEAVQRGWRATAP